MEENGERTRCFPKWVVALFCLFVAVSAEAQSDFDGDGIPDPNDNCSAHSNSNQRDVDRDGLGNRCDPDFNQDQIVNGEDVSTLATNYRSANPLYDLNGDGIVNVEDMKILQTFMNQPPGPGRPNDTDGDAVPNAEDLCWDSEPGSTIVSRGCSALDIARRPNVFTDPLIEEAVDIADRLEARTDIGSAATLIRNATMYLEGSASSLLKGDYSQSVNELANALRLLLEAQGDMKSRIVQLKEEIAEDNRVPRTFADHRPMEMDVLGIEVRESDLSKLIAATRDLRATFSRIGETATPVRRRARIAEIDDARRIVTLQDGTAIGLADGITLAENGIYPGQLVDISFDQMDSKSGLGDSITDAGGGTAPPLNQPHCLQLRFAPLQRFAPVSNGPWIIHDPLAYDYGEDFHVEQGMGLAAEKVGCQNSGDIITIHFNRYTMDLVLKYKNKLDDIVTTTLATDLGHGEHPALIPSNVKPGTVADLTVTQYVQSCTILGLNLSCSAKGELFTTVKKLQVFQRRGLCVAIYDSTEFDLDDDDMVGFRPAFVSNHIALVGPDPNTSTTFRADGYRYWANATSSYPTVLSVTNDDTFAIFNHDFWDPELLYAEESVGIDRRSGLRFPRVTGVRNSKPFRYGCSLPKIVRDVVTFCSGTDSYYRLPFQGGFPIWIMGQGNNGSFTHNGMQQYAFDFIAPMFTNIHAARGGKVKFVREDQNANSYYDPNCGCDANALVIRHQDGSESAYFHMPVNGVYVDEGDFVYRGDFVAKVGNTGYSTDPHLHFQEQDSTWQTYQSKFQGYYPFSFNLRNCWIPESGDFLSSNNY